MPDSTLDGTASYQLQSTEPQPKCDKPALPNRHQSRLRRQLHPKRLIEIPSSLPPSSPPSLSSKLPSSSPTDEFSPDDPFGFLAVEQKLKATRIINPPPLNIISSRSSLLTPRKPKRKVLHSSGDSRTESMPSTPSPSKPVPGTVLAPRNPGTNLSRSPSDDPLLRLESARNTGPHTGKKSVTSKKRTKTSKPQASEKSMDPEELARNLEALLPKRPVKRPDKIPAPAKKHSNGKGKETVNEVEKVEKRGKRKGKARTGEGKVKVVEDVVDEKWVQERQARLEYFKKLDGYVVRKENVWIV